MAAAALTPRVRIMAVCDRVRESKSEAGVFDLKGVRQVITCALLSMGRTRETHWSGIGVSTPRLCQRPNSAYSAGPITAICFFHLFESPSLRWRVAGLPR